jgi:butyrate kinase
MADALILVVNLGAASSKFALYRDHQAIAEASLALSDVEARLPLIKQRPLRLLQLQGFLAEQKSDAGQLAALAARGGMMKPLSRRGVIRVDAQMLSDLESTRYGEHPSNLSALIAVDLLAKAGVERPVYVVDPVSVDTLCDAARLSGVPGIQRSGRHHALNVQHVAAQAAERLGQSLHQLHLVVAHFGSGVSICSMQRGRVMDVNDAQLGEGPYSVTRAGSLPIEGLLQLAEAQQDHAELRRVLARQSGMAGYTGTGDFREIVRRLENGDSAAMRAYQGMLFQSAKYVAAYSGSLGRRPDAIVLTGAMMHSDRFRDELRARVDWIAPVLLFPGEAELQALADAVADVIEGGETAFSYSEIPTPAEAPPHGFDELISRAVDCPPLGFVIAGADHPEVAETVAYCLGHGFSGFVLVGNKEAILRELAEAEMDSARVEIIDSEDVVGDAIKAVQQRPGSVLVKGQCDSAALLKGVLASLPLEPRPFLSHCAVFEDAISGRLIGITDGGLNLAPDLEGKQGILGNAIAMFRALGVRRPHAMLAAGMEDKGQDLPAISDARAIVRLHHAGKWPEAVVDGPFGMEVALSSQAAMRKGIRSPVAGRADIIVTPNLESCNFSVKLAVIYTGQPWGGLILGGPFPVVLGSRADDVHNRVCSIALARLVTAGMARMASG